MHKQLDNIFMISGVIIMGLTLSVFLEPNNIVIGGATGLAIIVQDLSSRTIGYGIPLWFTNMVVNIPLFILAIKLKGFRFLRRTIFATLLLSLVLAVSEGVFSIEVDYVLASVFGGALSGIGIGLIFRGGATTGGSDLLASLIHSRLKSLSVARIMCFIDIIIISLGFFTFGSIATLYAIISVYIINKCIDAVLEGLDFAKAAFIFSDNTDTLISELMSSLDRGATILSGKGAYTKTEKGIILIVVSKKQVSKLKEITKSIDDKAFVIVTDVREVLGEF